MIKIRESKQGKESLYNSIINNDRYDYYKRFFKLKKPSNQSDGTVLSGQYDISKADDRSLNRMMKEFGYEYKGIDNHSKLGEVEHYTLHYIDKNGNKASIEDKGISNHTMEFRIRQE